MTVVNNGIENFWGNVVTAMVTPMRVSDPISSGSSIADAVTEITGVEVDFDAAAKLAVFLVNNGSDALVLSGTTGEAPATHIEEKDRLIRVVRTALEEAFPGRHIPLIAGVGSNDAAHVLKNSTVAAGAGADALLIVAPYYSRPSQAGIVQHFSLVANATDLPVILYDVPGRAGVEITESSYKELAKIPNIVAFKDATGNVFNAYKKLHSANAVRRANGLQDLTLYAGDDSLLLPFLSLGARGIISVASHIAGSQMGEVISKYQIGEHQKAADQFFEIVPAIELLNGTGQQAGCSKAALQSIGVLDNRILRLPNCGLSEGEYGDFTKKLNDWRINNASFTI
jgi:4-hydroxy-tetrahydrodipicolinate synthase